MRMLTVAVMAALLAVAGLAGPAHARTTAPRVTAKEVYLIDAATGTPQFARRETRRVPVASLTKIMTAYVVRRSASLDAVVTITKADVRHAAANGAARAGLKAGERLSVRDLLYALLLPSGADAAGALARTYGPGVRRFVGKMNAAARSLGMRDTFYTNPDGMPQPGGDHSTAFDQVTLAKTVLADPIVAQVAGTKRHAVAKTPLHRGHVWKNTNRLLPDDAQGLKTGYTRPAGYCLMFAAARDGRTYIGVILGERTDAARYRTARSLLDAATAAAAAA
ncbi:D-alanyl-D-alanine carboxypeptidase family protein [Sphaerisporangium krabiense]|uniref:D-alanyl-D-alanine carboxypeptidase (Penicillin-binding protein 5/6) n=1 Tax=Sphaerisporangium krabiense TaxID=763782 RepID=A0A7W8Z685_9ACTN|nr:serine hydrolase [Sphaerisporangium krabiense]MBB5628261.1 D-alanyl-D-alanine carboxypeptidase (penicillin-binding protein 5/6) [Sphaerisporangium krabiense]